MSVYYNELDPFAVAWLRELMKADQIPDGEVDDRSIELVQPGDLRGFQQCHFFAGIGGWAYALRLAGWPDDRDVWTGSCPCQPFSVAGDGSGASDRRDLWPVWRELIRKCRPPTVFGEQVEAAVSFGWWDRVCDDMENAAYACAAVGLPAASVTAPHLRERLYFVADAGCKRRQQECRSAPSDEGEDGQQPNSGHVVASDGEGSVGSVANANSGHGFWWNGPLQVGWNAIEAEIERGGRKYRAQWRIKPGLSLLAHGVPGRVGQVCGFGNAIVPQVAQAFIEAYLDVCDESAMKVSAVDPVGEEGHRMTTRERTA